MPSRARGPAESTYGFINIHEWSLCRKGFVRFPYGL